MTYHSAEKPFTRFSVSKEILTCLRPIFRRRQQELPHQAWDKVTKHMITELANSLLILRERLESVEDWDKKA